ncbi:hypothetical protein ACHAWO_011173 [Cyclotella atomus]|uniref:SAP domain-containing protein n=1 Tax=Cyclotella atomus TaxID=382360 RepID=A0ABD3NRY0_9STRA
MDDIDDEEEESPPIIDGFDLDSNDLGTLTQENLSAMTVMQLKQQLRLRGKSTSGKKQELIERLLDQRSSSINGSTVHKDLSTHAEVIPNNSKQAKKIAEAKSKGANLVDVTEYIDAEEIGKSFRSSDRSSSVSNSDNDIDNDSSKEKEEEESSPEVWGEDAKIVQDYEGRSVVVDGLSRTVIEYKGCNDTVVQAYVVGSRDALVKFLRGGNDESNNTETAASKEKKYASLEEEVYDIQRKRELQTMRGMPADELLDNEDGLEPMARDAGDWGVWTPTGAQLSATEVQGVLLLSDVYGPFTENTQALADKIAFECQPVVVLVPDLFRGNPWTEEPSVGEDGVERNGQRKSYEEWRVSHPDRRVDVDIRAAAAVLRERYAVSSIAVWGTCFGGGRALEAASAWYSGGVESYYNDAFSSRPPPPHVDPVACIAWYPTRYDAKKLFGKSNEGFRTFENGDDRSVAVMAVFAEEDTLPGATKKDAALLKDCLDEDPRVKDVMVKVFANQKHGFAHNIPKEYTDGFDDDRFVIEDGYGGRASLVEHEYSNSDAEVACLLSTAWMETYTRMFLPTIGEPVRDEEENPWSDLEASGYKKEKRDIRQEIEDSIANFVPPEVDFSEVEDRNSDFLDAPPEELERVSMAQDRIRERLLEKIDKYGINFGDDDDEVFTEKIQRMIDDGVLNEDTISAFYDGDESKLGW